MTKRRKNPLPVLDDKGESVVEALASILIVALSTLLLLSCVMTAAENDKKAEKVDAAHYAALSEAEARADAGSAPTPISERVMIVKDPKNTSDPGEPLNIKIYGGEGVFSYVRGEP